MPYSYFFLHILLHTKLKKITCSNRVANDHNKSKSAPYKQKSAHKELKLRKP